MLIVSDRVVAARRACAIINEMRKCRMESTMPYAHDGQRHHSIFVWLLFTYISEFECESSIMGSHSPYTRALKLAWKCSMFTMFEHSSQRVQCASASDLAAYGCNCTLNPNVFVRHDTHGVRIFVSGRWKFRILIWRTHFHSFFNTHIRTGHSAHKQLYAAPAGSKMKND